MRTKEKGDKVTAVYPNVKLVLGGLDDSDLLQEEAAKADVVIRTSLHTEI